jgi:hypothetical protein
MSSTFECEKGMKAFLEIAVASILHLLAVAFFFLLVALLRPLYFYWRTWHPWYDWLPFYQFYLSIGGPLAA